MRDIQILITQDGLSQSPTQKRFRILFLTNWYPNRENPVEGVFVQEIARAVSIFHEVIVIHNCGGDPALDQPWKLDLEEISSLTKESKPIVSSTAHQLYLAHGSCSQPWHYHKHTGR